MATVTINNRITTVTLVAFFVVLVGVFLFIYWQLGGFSGFLVTQKGCEIFDLKTEGLAVALPGVEGNFTVARSSVDAHDDPITECLLLALKGAAQGSPAAIVIKDVKGKGSSVAIKTQLIRFTKQLTTLLGESFEGTPTQIGAYYVWTVITIH